MRRAVFLDRDGTLVREKHYLAQPEALELLPGSGEALRLLRQTGLALVLVSNQSGVARGYFDEAQVAAVHARLAELLAAEDVVLDGVYYCPHHPEAKLAAYRLHCDCRKPAAGMLRRAARELALELDGSWVVGDKPEDLALGRGQGLRPVLVRTGYGAATERGLGAIRPPVCEDLLAAAALIRDEEERG